MIPFSSFQSSYGAALCLQAIARAICCADILFYQPKLASSGTEAPGKVTTPKALAQTVSKGGDSSAGN